MNRATLFDAMGKWLILAAAIAFALTPILWGISTAFKDASVAESFPPTWWPDSPTLENFRTVFAGTNFGRYMLNSAFICAMTIAMTLAIAIPAGYAAARWTFPGKNKILYFILSMGMVPGICILVPLYLLVSYFNIYDTYIGLIIVYTAWKTPTAVWIMRGFFETLPKELEEAAYLDGCGRWEAIRRVALPLSQPGMAAVAIIVFIYVWNEFLIAYALTISDARRTTQSGLYLYVTIGGIEWANVMAATVIAMLPPAIAFILLQSRFIQGLTNGAIR